MLLMMFMPGMMFMMPGTMFLVFFRILSSILIFVIHSTSTFGLLNWIVLWYNRSIIMRMFWLTRLLRVLWLMKTIYICIVLCRDKRIIIGGPWQVLWLVILWSYCIILCRDNSIIIRRL